MKKTIVSLMAASALAAFTVPAFANDVESAFIDTNNDYVAEELAKESKYNKADIFSAQPGVSSESFVTNIENNEILPAGYKPEVIATEVRLVNGVPVETPIYSDAPARVEGTTAPDAATDPKATAPTAPAETPATPAPTAPAVDVAATRNELLKDVDASALTDEKKGELAEKIAFAETAEELAALKAEFTKLTAPKASESKEKAQAPKAQAAAASTKSAKGKATLPETGDASSVAAFAGSSLLASALGLAGVRRRK